MSQKVLCIFHRNCVDGFASAWVLAQHFGFDHVEFVEANYHDPVPDISQREVYIVDFSYTPRELMGKLGRARKVTMIDHHRDRLLEWMHVETPSNFRLISDLTGVMSGATLTWKHFNQLSEIPRLLQHCQDWDTWAFKLQRTKEIITALKARGYYQPSAENFKAFGDLVRGTTGLQTLFDEGQVLKRANLQLMEGWIARNSTLVELDGFLVPMANVPYEFASETGHILSQGYPFSITYEDNLATGKRKYSLRSEKDKGMDVAKIAQRYGGNGHPSAAGFTLPLHTDPAGLRIITEPCACTSGD